MKGARNLGNNLFLYRYIFRAAPGYVLLTVFFAIFQSVLVFFEHTWSIKLITEAIQYQRPFAGVVAYLALIVVLIILNFTFSALFYHRTTINARQKVKRKLQDELLTKAVGVDLAFYDDTQYYTDFVWGVSQAPSRVDLAMDHLFQLLKSVTTVAVSGAFLLFFDVTAFAFVGLSLGLSLWWYGKLGRSQAELEQDVVPERKKMASIARLFYLADYAKEVRLENVQAPFQRDFSSAADRIQTQLENRSWRHVWMGFCVDFFASGLLIDGLLMAYLVVETVVFQRYSYGVMVALFTSVSRVMNGLQTVNGLFPEFVKLGHYIEKVRHFLGLESRIVGPPDPLPVPAEHPWVLEFRNVSFSYPVSPGKAAEPVLHDISFRITQGERLAIVGHNGAGKTSLTKLLLRLYDPTEGVILLNGIDIRRFDPAEYRTHLASLFQDFTIFAADLGQNVALDFWSEGDRPGLEQALEKAGFGERYRTLDQGLSQPLTKEYDADGVNFSRGENQKVALARVHSKPHEMAIMDEPSSALDPESEYHLNRDLEKAAQDQGLIFISHRLSSTQGATRILHLEKGRILEEGSHDELMARQGGYCTMFTQQASRYRPVVEA